MAKSKKRKLKGIHIYINPKDYDFLKNYCENNGQRGDYSLIIRTAIHQAVVTLEKVCKTVEKEE